MKSSALAPLLNFAYQRFKCGRRWRVGGIIIDIIQRLEGGQMYSATARQLLAKHHRILIGAYSYGECFKPGSFPPDVVVGRYTSISAHVRVANENHPLNTISTHPFFYVEGENRKKLTIGSDVWIGVNAVILPGCSSIGHGAVVGAGAVLTKDVPPYAIVGGVPAKVLSYRFDPDTVGMLLESRWWELPVEVVREFMKFPIPEYCQRSKEYLASNDA